MYFHKTLDGATLRNLACIVHVFALTIHTKCASFDICGETLIIYYRLAADGCQATNLGVCLSDGCMNVLHVLGESPN